MAWTVPADEDAIGLLDRSIQQGRLAHAWLLTGPAGVGGLALAREFAKALLCEAEQGRPCGECRQCQRVASGHHADVMLISPAGTGSIGIEAARDLQAAANLQPYEATGRVIIIDDADTLTREAANALLKALEEPHPNVTLILVTANDEAILDTIRSRCQIVPLRPIPFDQVAEALRENGADDENANRLAKLSGGRLEYALSLLADTAPLDARRAALDDILAVRGEPVADLLRRAGRMADDFYADRQRLLARLEAWASIWRDALVVAGGTPQDIMDSDDLEQVREIGVNLRDAQSALNETLFTMQALRQNANARLALESYLLSLP